MSFVGFVALMFVAQTLNLEVNMKCVYSTLY